MNSTDLITLGKYAPLMREGNMDLRPGFITPTLDRKGWGAETILINCMDYCAKFLDFNAGSQGSLHLHRNKHETWYILSGEIVFTWVDTATATHCTHRLCAGDMVDIPRMLPHQVLAIQDTRIMEVSTPHEESDSYRILQGDSQTKEKING